MLPKLFPTETVEGRRLKLNHPAPLSCWFSAVPVIGNDTAPHLRHHGSQQVPLLPPANSPELQCEFVFPYWIEKGPTDEPGAVERHHLGLRQREHPSCQLTKTHAEISHTAHVCLHAHQSHEQRWLTSSLAQVSAQHKEPQPHGSSSLWGWSKTRRPNRKGQERPGRQPAGQTLS